MEVRTQLSSNQKIFRFLVLVAALINSLTSFSNVLPPLSLHLFTLIHKMWPSSIDPQMLVLLKSLLQPSNSRGRLWSINHNKLKREATRWPSSTVNKGLILFPRMDKKIRMWYLFLMSCLKMWLRIPQIRRRQGTKTSYRRCYSQKTLLHHKISKLTTVRGYRERAWLINKRK
jgi:hypothetical protein